MFIPILSPFTYFRVLRDRLYAFLHFTIKTERKTWQMIDVYRKVLWWSHGIP